MLKRQSTLTEPDKYQTSDGISPKYINAFDCNHDIHQVDDQHTQTLIKPCFFNFVEAWKWKIILKGMFEYKEPVHYI